MESDLFIFFNFRLCFCTMIVTLNFMLNMANTTKYAYQNRAVILTITIQHVIYILQEQAMKSIASIWNKDALRPHLNRQQALNTIAVNLTRFMSCLRAAIRTEL